MFDTMVEKIENIFNFDLNEDKSTFNQVDIELIEKKIGITLPADYSHYLLNYGNNYIKEEYKFEYVKGDIKKSIIIDCLFGLHNDSLNIYKKIDFYKEILPTGFLAIASISGGDLVCLKGNKVFLWKHDAFENIIQLAESFTDFINGFKISSKELLDTSNVKLNFSPKLDALIKEAAKKMNNK